VEFPSRPLAVTRLPAAPSTAPATTAAGPILLLAAATAVAVLLAAVTVLLAAARLRVAIRVGRALPVAGCEHDLQLVQFVPLGVGALAFRYGQQRLQARARGIGLRFVHNPHYLTVRRTALAPLGGRAVSGE